MSNEYTLVFDEQAKEIRREFTTWTRIELDAPAHPASRPILTAVRMQFTPENYVEWPV